MPEPLRALLLEDREDDAALIIFELQRAGFAPQWLRVDDAQAFSTALEPSLDVILADYSLPDWNGLAALEVVLASGLDIPFILVSGTVGEDVAVEAMRRGAADYLLKDRLTRLGAAVRQQLENKRLRAERRAEEEARTEERRIAEEQLRASEARYRDLIENSSDIIQSVAPDGRFQYVNAAWHKALGYDEEDLAKLTMFDVVSEDSRPHCLTTFAEVMVGKPQKCVEADFVTKSGARIAVEGSVSCRTENATVVAARCIFRDVTEQKRAASALRKAAMLLRIAGSTARIGGWRIAVPAARLTLSDEICDILDLPRGSSPTAEEALRFCVEEWQERFWAAYNACWTEGTPFDLELELVTATGRRMWGRSIGEAERNEAGDVVAVQGSFQDITARRNAEAALRASERKYREVVDFAPVGFYQTAVDGEVTLINRALAEMLGYSSVEEILGRVNVEQLHVAPGARRGFLALLEHHGTASAEMLIRSKDDQQFWAEVNARAIRDESGRMIAAEGFITNIDRRKKAEQALRESEGRYRMLIESAEEVIVSLSPDGILTSVNPAFERLAGRPSAEWIGRSFWDLIDDSDRERVQKAWNIVLSGVAVPPAYVQVRTPERVRTIHASSSPVLQDGEVVRIAAIARDVTDEWRMQRERNELTARLHIVLESIDEGLYAMDAAGLCTMINRSGAELLGYRPDELLGRPMHDLIHHSAPAGESAVSECPARLVMKTGKSARSSDERFWTKSGASFPVEMSCSPIFDGESLVGSVVTFTDITRRRAAERQLEQASRVDSLGRLAATVAHEFNNVLMGIQPFAEIIGIRATADEKVADAATRIQRSVKRGKTIAQEILRFTQPSTPSLQAVPLGAWLQNLITEARALMPPGIELLVGDVAAGLTVMADPAQLHQAFMNMMLNARDAMPAGGRVTISTAVDDDGRTHPFGVIDQPGRYVHLTVADTGCGIPTKVLDHVFEPLFTTKRSGTGIGLAVTHQIVRSQGGQIFVESEPEQGTRLHVFIPCAQPSAVVPQVAEATSPQASVPMRLLLVEDDSAVAEGVSGLLRTTGMQVDMVDCGAMAFEAVRRTRPDVVILDVGLPDMDGEAVYEQLVAEWPEIPVVFSTGHADRARLQHLLDRGNVACIMKPYEIEALLDLLRGLGARRATESA